VIAIYTAYRQVMADPVANRFFEAGIASPLGAVADRVIYGRFPSDVRNTVAGNSRLALPSFRQVQRAAHNGIDLRILESKRKAFP